MLSQSQWLDAVKGRLRVRSDYALSKRWAVTPSEVSQYRRNRLRFPFAIVLDIADVMDIDPIEIIAGLEYTRCRERDRERVKRAYFKAHCAHFVYPNNPGFFHRKKRFFG
ncbi:TPA: hypothetical protein ACQUHZ_000045 [Neisseria cinerea]|nr:hypothetical protein [Neisseria meningitidis]MBH5782579.1 hypothetical protein [Neisseria meningitidis]